MRTGFILGTLMTIATACSPSAGHVRPTGALTTKALVTTASNATDVFRQQSMDDEVRKAVASCATNYPEFIDKLKCAERKLPVLGIQGKNGSW